MGTLLDGAVYGGAPVLINKLSHGAKGDMQVWNNYPRDAANIAGWYTRNYETLVNWQVLDISTAKVEESLQRIKRQYTVVIAPHSVQQAARIADLAAFFLQGELIEVGPGPQLFVAAKDKRTNDYVTGRFG